MTNKSTTKRNIRNPEKWIGKYVRGMANWRDFQWAYDDGYFVCEWTGKLTKVEDEGYPIHEEEKAAYETVGYDWCYSYSWEAIIDFQKAAEAKGLI